jgi:hypothetical protein
MGAILPVTDGAHVMRRGDIVECGGGGGGLLEPPARLLVPPSELVPEVVVVLGLAALLEEVLDLV